MTDTVFSAIIGGLSGSTVTFFGNYFFPIWQENRKKKKREKEILRPRRERLLNLLKEQLDSNGQLNYPTYEIGQLCAAVGLSENNCKELLVNMGAWGYRSPAYTNKNLDIINHEYWSMNPKAFFTFTEEG